MFVEPMMARAALANAELDMECHANLRCKLSAFGQSCATLAGKFGRALKG